jgi:hypothetical protein
MDLYVSKPVRKTDILAAIFVCVGRAEQRIAVEDRERPSNANGADSSLLAREQAGHSQGRYFVRVTKPSRHVHLRRDPQAIEKLFFPEAEKTGGRPSLGVRYPVCADESSGVCAAASPRNLGSTASATNVQLFDWSQPNVTKHKAQQGERQCRT